MKLRVFPAVIRSLEHIFHRLKLAILGAPSGSNIGYRLIVVRSTILTSIAVLVMSTSVISPASALAQPVECPAVPLTTNTSWPTYTYSNLPVRKPSKLGLAYPNGGINIEARNSLMSATKYILTTWFPRCFGYQSGPITPNTTDFRDISTAAYVIAVSLKTGAFDESYVGITKKSALYRARQLLIGASLKHRSHNNASDRWGRTWQSSYWAFYLGTASWLLYDNLNPVERQITARVAMDEADYQLSKGSDLVKYYANKDGHINTPGDTKAEEDAWDSTILSLMSSLLPTHPRSAQWERAAAALQIGSYARESDINNDEVVNGKSIKDWVNGWNINNDGTLVNHGILSPEYMGNIGLKLNAVQLAGLSGKPALRSSVWNFDIIYDSLVNTSFSAESFFAPGGTIYVDNSSSIYFPQGNDWGTVRVSNYALLDSSAATYKISTVNSPRTWMGLHLAKQIELQNRHSDGRTYSGLSTDDGSEYTYRGRELVTAGDLAQIWIGQYLSFNGLVSFTNETVW